MRTVMYRAIALVLLTIPLPGCTQGEVQSASANVGKYTRTACEAAGLAYGWRLVDGPTLSETVAAMTAESEAINSEP